MSFLSKFLPKRKPIEIKNNVPKEKENIKKTFGVYCQNHHGAEAGQLCPKCTALLATVLTKITRCPYGITKPICDRCERPCFGDKQTKDFLAVMATTQKSMLLKHPVMTVKHKLASWSVDYAKYQQEKKTGAKKDEPVPMPVKQEPNKSNKIKKSKKKKKK